MLIKNFHKEIAHIQIPVSSSASRGNDLKQSKHRTKKYKSPGTIERVGPSGCTLVLEDLIDYSW
jgi:hypothetical protein